MLTTTAPDAGPPSHVPLRVWSAGEGRRSGRREPSGRCDASTARRSPPPPTAGCSSPWSDGASLNVTEREPGGTFAAPVRLGEADPRSGFTTGVTVGSAGEASVSWVQSGPGEAQIASRRTPGAFGPPTRIALGEARAYTGDPFFNTQAFQDLYFGGGTRSYGATRRGPVLTPDGRAAIASTQPGWLRPVLAFAPLGGGAGSRAPAGRALDSVGVVHALALSDGAPAIAWTERLGARRFRLQLAAEGVQERPQPAPPRVTFGTPRSTTLSDQEPLRLPITCSRPCVVFAGLGDDASNGEFVTLPRGGRGELKIEAAGYFAPRSAGPVKLTFRYRAPDALRARSRTTHVRIARGADVPHPQVADLRAVRRGESIRVSWRVTGPIGKATGRTTSPPTPPERARASPSRHASSKTTVAATPPRCARAPTRAT